MKTTYIIKGQKIEVTRVFVPYKKSLIEILYDYFENKKEDKDDIYEPPKIEK
ncbi:MAG: hypothetical protein R3Y05_05975 [bacterium]